MTFQGRLAVALMCVIGCLYAWFMYGPIPPPVLNPLAITATIVFLVLIFPIGLVSVPSMLCRRSEIDPVDVLIAGTTFALNAYLWAWIIRSAIEKRTRKQTAQQTAAASPSVDRQKVDG